MSQELDTARTTQQVLIPNTEQIRTTETDYRMRIHEHYRPCSILGGDFWGFKSLSSDELAVYMVDFSGHGVNAALNVFRLHALMQAAIGTAKAPGAYLTHLNAILAPMLPTGQFATMFYGVINRKTHKLSYASAAAPEPILFMEGGKHYQTLENRGMLLGAFKESAYQTLEIPFNPGDGLFLYSDALTETPDADDSMIPIEHWANAFLDHLKKSKNDSGKAFAAMLSDFDRMHAPYLTDDLTLAAYFLED